MSLNSSEYGTRWLKFCVETGPVPSILRKTPRRLFSSPVWRTWHTILKRPSCDIDCACTRNRSPVRILCVHSKKGQGKKARKTLCSRNFLTCAETPKDRLSTFTRDESLCRIADKACRAAQRVASYVAGAPAQMHCYVLPCSFCCCLFRVMWTAGCWKPIGIDVLWCLAGSLVRGIWEVCNMQEWTPFPAWNFFAPPL